jgi:hypothetical protein
MTTYTKLIVDKYEQYILFDEDYIDIFEEMFNITSKEDVTVDPNNCIKLWTYDNEEEQLPEGPIGTPYIFSNKEDKDFWLEYNNSDGHQNNPYYMIVIENGVETIYSDPDDCY